jgi:hypothetical protein
MSLPAFLSLPVSTGPIHAAIITSQFDVVPGGALCPSYPISPTAIDVSNPSSVPLEAYYVSL